MGLLGLCDAMGLVFAFFFGATAGVDVDELLGAVAEAGAAAGVDVDELLGAAAEGRRGRRLGRLRRRRRGGGRECAEPW